MAKRLRGWWAVVAALSLLGSASTAQALGLSEAIHAALDQHPAVEGAQAGVEAARAETKAIGKAKYPILRTEAGVQLWAEEQVLDIGGGGGALQLPPPRTPYEMVIAGMMESFGKPMTVRELVTANIRVQVVQPLSDLWRISIAEEVSEHGVEAARLQIESAKRQISAGVAEAYLRVLQAQVLAKTAEAGVEALQARESAVAALVEGGLMASTARLQIEVARRAAQQDVLAAQNAVATARAGLAMAMGRPLPADTALDETLPGWAQSPISSLEQAIEQAIEADVELSRARTQVRQAQGGVSIEKAARWPSVNLVAQYEHMEGSELSQSDSLFVGAMLNWTVFEWGASGDRIEAASARARGAQTMVSVREQQLRFAVEKAWLDYKTAEGQVEVAEAAIAPAESNTEMLRAQLEVQKTTATELVDAEVALTQTRARLEAARSERVIALVRLRQALGLPLVEGER